MYLDGHPIPQTPFGVKVGPATLHAPACAVRGLADACPHGMLEFEVHGRDAFGNSLQLLPRCAPAPTMHHCQQWPLGVMHSDSKHYLITLLEGMSHWQEGSCKTYTTHAGCWRWLRTPRNVWRMWPWPSGRRPQSSLCAAM